MRATTARPLVPPFLSSRSASLLTFLVAYLFLARYCQHLSFADPTSLFFDPVKGHERHYSIQREDEANHYLSHLNISGLPSTSPRANPPRMCVGIPTIAREGEQYVRKTIGSLLAGLEPHHRHDIHLLILIANTFPHNHPVFHETWLESAVDEVAFYNVSQDTTNMLTQWEKGREFGKKGLFDYSYTLQRCLDTGAEWITMLEDDTLAAEGWYPRTIDALARADDQHRHEHQDWLYLRLFFTEEFLGWNVEEAPLYLLRCIFVFAGVAGSLLVIRQFVSSRYLTDSFIITTAFVYTPALILLYFATGRMTMQPLSPGVHEMPKFGCCAQGFVFPRNMAARVVSYLDSVGEGFVDQLLEEWANSEGFVRWSVVPSLLQHIGRHSSKGDDFGVNAKFGQSVAEKIWSFGFEKLNAA